VEGCGRVYHTAAGFLMWAKDTERSIIRPSVDGTRNLMKAAARAGVEKVLYVSTGGTIGFADTPDKLRTEADYNTKPHTPYFIGKIAAEKEAFAIGARENVAVTAINPGLILGPRFWKVSESTRQVVDFLNQGMPVYFDGGFGVVDVEDVANGAMLGMNKAAARPGCRAGRDRSAGLEAAGAGAARDRDRHGGRQLGHRLASHARPQPGGRVCRDI